MLKTVVTFKRLVRVPSSISGEHAKHAGPRFVLDSHTALCTVHVASLCELYLAASLRCEDVSVWPLTVGEYDHSSVYQNAIFFLFIVNG